jgi:hypothetical protein
MYALLGLLLMAPPHPPPPPRVAAPLRVKFELTRFVEDTETPTLRVTATNSSGAPVPFITFSSDECFAEFYLSLTVKRSGDAEPLPRAGCAIRSFPGAKGELAAGASITTALSFAKLYPRRWPLGPYAVDVDWNPERLRHMLGGRFDVRASQQSHNATGFTIIHALGTLSLLKGQSIELPRGGRFSFEAHGHKRTMEGDESPLIIRGAIAGPGQSPQPYSINVFASESRYFHLGPQLLFRLDGSEYDQSMQLTYFGHVDAKDP